MRHYKPDTPAEAQDRGALEAQLGHYMSDCPYSGPRLRAAWRRGFATYHNLGRRPAYI